MHTGRSTGKGTRRSRDDHTLRGGVSVHAGRAMCDSLRAPEEARDAPRDDHKLRGDVHGPALDGPGAAERAAGDHFRWSTCVRAFIHVFISNVKDIQFMQILVYIACTLRVSCLHIYCKGLYM